MWARTVYLYWDPGWNRSHNMARGRGKLSLEEQKIALLEDAQKLGYEVGIKGHLDNVGEFGAKKRELLKSARNLGILEKMMFKYAAAKEAGTKERRMSIYSRPKTSPTESPRRTVPKSAPDDRPPVEIGQMGLHFEDENSLSDRRESARISISPRNLINLVEAADAESSAKYRRFYDVLLNLADASDQVRYVRGRATLENVLLTLKENGWIGKYVIEIYSPESNEVLIKLQSNYAIMHDRDSKPVCRIIARAIERAVSASFGREVRVVETRCIAQGNRICEFSSF